MRLKRLELKAFGPFTDRMLRFDTEDPGLHIIFGPNEAGKSSSLRALKALLYGFPQQTPDNFIHNYDQLLVGGCLINSAGEELVFQRRKKRIGDVLDELGNPIDIGMLTPFLQGVEPELFASLYGIDHDTLVRGGEEILAQKGEVGQALFAAGAGISSLREVILQLEKEAGELFKAAGQNPEINKAIKRYKDLQKEARETSLSARDWQDLQKLLTLTRAERTGLENEREGKTREIHRLERLAHAIPELAALQLRRNQLLALGEVVPLPPGFAERYLQVSQEIRDAEQQLLRDTERLGKLRKRHDAISLNRQLLDQVERVDDFHQRLGEYRKGQKDRPERNGMRITLRTEAGRLLQQVRADLDLNQSESLRSVLSRKRTVQTLSGQYEAIQQRLLSAQKQSRVAEQERGLVEHGLASIAVGKEPQKLLQVFKLAQKVGDIDVLLAKSRTDIDLSKKECQSELKRIGLWSGDLGTLMELSLPLSATVQRFENNLSELIDQRRELEKERRTNDRELKKNEADLARIEKAGLVPSEEELIRTRAKREQGWQLVRRQWLDQEDIREESQLYASDISLPQAYEGYVQQADHLADRLRLEADRVAGAAALQTQAETLRGALAANDRELGVVGGRIQELHGAWLGVWQPVGVAPLSPKEMSGWLNEIDKFRFKVGDILKREQEISRGLKRRQELRFLLDAELRLLGEENIPEGDGLQPLMVMAETVLEKIAAQKLSLEKLQERREKALQAVWQAREDAKGAEQALARWQEQWSQAIAGLGENDRLSPLEAVDRIDILQSCFDKLKEGDDLQKRIDGIDRDASLFERETNELLAIVAPDMVGLPLDQTILQLRVMLDQAQKDGALQAQLAGEIEGLQDEVGAIGQTLERARQQLGEILQLGKCTKAEELTVVIDRFTAFKTLQEKIADTEANLARIGAGIGFEELARQAAAVNIDDLPGMLAVLSGDIVERINPAINRVSQEIGEINLKLAAMDGSPRAADLAEKMEQELALMRRLAERYAVIKLAAKILQQEIERYREEHQDPVLEIGSRYFGELTTGSFTGLRTDMDDKGEPILVGVRPGGLRLTVDKMSSGTRDQLFLALRLATLEWRLTNSEPMPFIVDDILINFDDSRSKATLSVLAELAKKNQIILFTHHRQIVDEARTITGRGEIVIHEL